MTRCAHITVVRVDGGRHPITDEELQDEWVKIFTFLDYGMGRFRCTQCGEINYYTSAWRDFYERGTWCSGADHFLADQLDPPPRPVAEGLT
jgi:hypothetical protein